MSLVYITGISASGKSSILKTLQELGFEAHGVDEEGFADWVDRETNLIVPFAQDDLEVSIHDWYRDHLWVLSHERISDLKKKSDIEDKVFVLVGYGDDHDNVDQLFDQVIYLAVDLETIKQRVANRINNDFGKQPEEMAAIVKWLDENDRSYRNSRARVIDATKPLDDVVRNVIELLTAI